MSQHDMNLANGDGATVRADMNNALAALVSQNSGATAPSTTFAYQLWADTTSGRLKQRNAANSAWVDRGPLGTNGLATLASAATLDLDAATSNYLSITGTTTTTAVTLADGQKRTCVAAAAWPLTHGASLILPGAASYTCTAGDILHFHGESGGVVRVMIWKGDGTAVVAPSSNVNVRMRQTVISGAVTQVQIGTGLACNLLATSKPVRIAFAAGFGPNGAIDYVGSITSDQTGFWSGLAASATNYLFFDRNTGTGAITGVASTLPCIEQYSSAGAPSVTNGQHTYVIDEGIMYVGNGSTASAVQRVKAGEAVTGASSVSSVVTYALTGEYQSALTAVPSSSTRSAHSHNLGIDPLFYTVQSFLRFKTSWNGYSAGMVIPFTQAVSGGFYRISPVVAESRNTAAFIVGSTGLAGIATPETGPTSDATPTGTEVDYFIRVKRSW